jgi:hypothetical protein
MAFRDQILVISQPGALGPADLEDVIDAVRGLDMNDVLQAIEEQRATTAATADATQASARIAPEQPVRHLWRGLVAGRPDLAAAVGADPIGSDAAGGSSRCLSANFPRQVE